MNFQRLLTLADFLKTVPSKHFNLSFWIHIKEDEFEEGKTYDKLDVLHTCGATCCAFGYACMIPSFKKAGLKMTKDGFPKYKAYSSFGAAKLFFNLDCMSDVYWLFDPIEYPDNRRNQPKYVAKRIEAFVRKKQREKARTTK